MHFQRWLFILCGLILFSFGWKERRYFVHPLTALKTWIAINKMGALNHCLLHGCRQRCWLGSKGSLSSAHRPGHSCVYWSHFSHAGECLQKAKREYASFMTSENRYMLHYCHDILHSSCMHRNFLKNQTNKSVLNTESKKNYNLRHSWYL